MLSPKIKFFLLAALFCLTSKSWGRESVDRILAIVNNEVVTSSDLRALSRRLETSNLIDEMLLFGSTLEDLKKSPELQMTYLIRERLIESEIKRLNLTVTLEKVEAELREVSRKNNISRADLNNAIRAQGMSFADYQEFTRNRLERQNLIEQEISSKIRVSDEEVSSEYNRLHPDSESGVFEYSVAHILFNPRKGGPVAAESRAKDVLSKLRAGENFETLAQKYSEDPGFSPGGLLGVFKAGEFSKELESAVAKLQPGETSGLVTSRAGLHILKLNAKKTVNDPKFEKEKESIRARLFEQSFTKQFRVWLEARKEDSFIRRNTLQTQ